MREMILAETIEQRERRSRSCCPTSATTSSGIFEAMKGLPVTIRLLDPPLHEFLPHDERTQRIKVAKSWASRSRRSGSASRSCTR
jgi:pyruvate,orthophosphate dikinase